MNNLTVLLLESDASTANKYFQGLKKAGFNMIYHHEISAAIDAMRQTKIDCLIIDDTFLSEKNIVGLSRACQSREGLFTVVLTRKQNATSPRQYRHLNCNIRKVIIKTDAFPESLTEYLSGLRPL